MEETRKKRGRPAGEIIRKNRVHILLSDDELADLQKVSHVTGKSQNEIARDGITGQIKLYKIIQDIPDLHV